MRTGAAVVWPTLSPAVYARRARRPLPLPLDQPSYVLDRSARQGLFHGVRALGIAPGGEILVPAHEFGASWDLITPIVLSGPGVGRQTVVDIRENLRWGEVGHTLRKYESSRESVGRAAGLTLRLIDSSPVFSATELERRLGISYLAPVDARATGLAGREFDFISSTSPSSTSPTTSARLRLPASSCSRSRCRSRPSPSGPARPKRSRSRLPRSSPGGGSAPLPYRVERRDPPQPAGD